MIRREFKVNLKSFLIWMAILLGMFLIVYLIYPYIINDDTMKSMDELMEIFPPDVLKVFNMDITSISTAYGWLKTEGYMYILIIVGIYSSLLGANIVLKEENDKTIEYLSVLPVKRNTIMTNKIIVSVVYIFLMVIILGIFNYIALLISGDFDKKQFLLLSVAPLLVAYPLFGLNLFIATFLHKTKKTTGFCLGFVFVFYLFSIISELSEKVDFFKYFSIYTLVDTRNIIESIEINPLNIVISIVLSFIFIIGSYINYNRKEFI